MGSQNASGQAKEHPGEREGTADAFGGKSNGPGHGCAQPGRWQQVVASDDPEEKKEEEEKGEVSVGPSREEASFAEAQEAQENQGPKEAGDARAHVCPIQTRRGHVLHLHPQTFQQTMTPNTE